VFANDSTAYTDQIVNYTFSLNTEYSVMFSRISGVVYLYVNGAQVGSGANTRSAQNTAKVISIGRGFFTGYDYELPGKISDVRMYVGYGLTATEAGMYARGQG
jgi:hypothetical protein